MNTIEEQQTPVPQIDSPYAGLKPEETRRLNATISSADWELVRAVCPLHGTWNTILGLTVKHICDELRRRNITTYNPYALLAIVHECANSSLNRHTSPPHDTAGASGVPTTHPNDADVSTSTGSPAKGRKRGTGNR